MSALWALLGAGDVILAGLLIPWVLFVKNKYPVSTVAWILAIVLLPYVGGLLFLVFGLNRVQRLAQRKSGKQEAARTIGRSLSVLAPLAHLPGEGLDPGQDCLRRLATRVAGTHATSGNRIEILSDTNRAMGLMEQAIRSAEQTLHLEFYIWQPDRTGTRLRDLLVEKARAGVTVRFLFDGVGSLWLGRRFLRPMRDAGIRAASFLPGATLRERWSINLRSHRKICVVDGRVGFTGGMNVGDEYLGRVRSSGFWRDTHLKLEGPVVPQLQQVFAEDWFYATGEELTDPALFPVPDVLGHACAQVVPSGPTTETNASCALLFAALNEARERIDLATSYFVPPLPLQTALESAALRGVRVRLLLSGRTGYRITHLAGRSFYEPLLAAGVEIFEYERGLHHSKTLAVDGRWALVGSANFDARSLLLNFEAGVAMYDVRLAERLEEVFENDLRHARRIDLDAWRRRPVLEQLGESVCRLFAPVL
jgi:cardiolipin synthase